MRVLGWSEGYWIALSALTYQCCLFFMLCSALGDVVSCCALCGRHAAMHLTVAWLDLTSVKRVIVLSGQYPLLSAASRPHDEKHPMWRRHCHGD